jgi:hypothetical protein
LDPVSFMGLHGFGFLRKPGWIQLLVPRVDIIYL